MINNHPPWWLMMMIESTDLVPLEFEKTTPPPITVIIHLHPLI